jgi:hypothetical protein
VITSDNGLVDEQVQRGLLAHLVFERRYRFVPSYAVTQAKERTLHGDVQQKRRCETCDGVEQP